MIRKISVPTLFFVCAVLFDASPVLAQRTGAPVPVLRKNNRPIAVLKSNPEAVSPSKAALQARFAADRAMKRADWKAAAKTRLATSPPSKAEKLETLPGTGTLTEATDTGALSVTLTTAQPVTDTAFLDFNNAARVSPKDNETEFVQTGAQSEIWGEMGINYEPTASLFLGFAAKKKRYYFVSVTFEYKTPFGVELETNQMLAFPPSFGLFAIQSHYNEGVISSKTYDMEWIHDTKDNGIDGWIGFTIFLAKPGNWVFKSATIKEIAPP